MTTSYNQLIQLALDNYRQGLKKHKQSKRKNAGEAIKQKAHEIIRARLSLEEQSIVNQFTIALNQGLTAARQSKFVLASKFFVESHGYILSETLSTEGRFICQSFQEAAEAYLDYRNNNFEDAKQHLLKALAIDVILEGDYKYNQLVTHAHRLEMVINLTRIYFRAMDFESAMELASCIIGYLNGALAVLPLQGVWSLKLATLLPPELTKVHLETITRDIALALAGKEPKIAHKLFIVAARYLFLEDNNNAYYHPEINAWFVVKKAFLNKDIVTFLEQASQFLAEGYASQTYLWYTVVVDLVLICDELALPNSQMVKQEIAKDAIQWQDFPETFFGLIGVR